MRKTEQTFACADDIREAVDQGLDVYWSSLQYPVRQDAIGRYVIGPPGGHIIELTWADGETLNGRPEEFFVLDKGTMH